MNRLRAAIASVVVLSAALAVGSASPAGAGLGSGSPSMTVSATTVPADRATNVTVRGTDFLVPPHTCPGAEVRGGVYLMFGWVASDAGWGPSNRSSDSTAGVFGYTYAYPGAGGDANIRDDGSGRFRLVAFTAGGESGTATPFHMDCNGNWETSMTIQGPEIEYVMPATGEVRTIDCRNLAAGRCGIFSIGAHGTSSATNEKFVPITFAGPAAPSGADDGQVLSGAVDSGAGAVADPGAVIEEVVEVASPFDEGDGAGGFADGATAGRAAGVPGASASPVAVAVAGSSVHALEPISVLNTGRIPRWLVPAAVAIILSAVGANVLWRRRTGPHQEVAS